MFAVMPRIKTIVNLWLIAVILFNGLVPSTAAALASSTFEKTDSLPASLAGQGNKAVAAKLLSPKRVILQQTNTATALPTETETATPEPSLTPAPTLEGTPTATVKPTLVPSDTPTSTQTSNSPAASSDLAVEFSATPNQAKAGDQVTFTLQIVNNGKSDLTSLHFSNILPQGFNAVQSDDKGFIFDANTRELTWKQNLLDPGQQIPVGGSLILTYTALIESEVNAAQVIDTATLRADGLKEPLRVEVTLILLSQESSLTTVDTKDGDALVLDGRIKIKLPEKSLETAAAVFVQDLGQETNSEGEPWLKFKIELYSPPQETTPVPNPGSQETDRTVPLESIEAKFNEAVELSVSFDGLADLATLGADMTPFLVTLDEASNTWVRMPLKSIDREANKITAELTHFSTWGVGFGPSFPSGANVLLFDSAYPTLFTGRSKYSIPLWTPPGRNGIQPHLALSYSSGSVDGVLGDVQAPWTGMGWSIETAEIARKITNSGASTYGYENKFMLLINGTGYELLPDATTAGRYHTKEESFMYIQLHNDSLGNNNPAATNATGEWWEVVEKDGTRWRLGWTTDSEQLAAMKGYPGTNPPTGAWVALGYAGNEPNVVAGRWRVDQVTDVYGNQMNFGYAEESRVVAGTSANYDRANYIDTISYTSHPAAPALSAGYSVVFVRESRGTNDVPTAPTEWSNWDTYRLDRIDVKYGTTVVRTYDLGHTIRSYSDGSPVVNWQTTTLTSLATSGGATAAPTVTFTYVDKDNRAANGSSSIEWAYPRLTTINNGWGGTTTYTYANDGRPYTSWYNWKVSTLDVTDSVHANPARTTFSYNSPCYDDPTTGWCNAGNVGGLIGYAQTIVTALEFDLTTISSKAIHNFTNQNQQFAGTDYETKYQDASGTDLRVVNTIWTSVETSGYRPEHISSIQALWMNSSVPVLAPWL